MRSIAGGFASEVSLSSWFLLSVGMLSLFLAIEKRKAEMLSVKNNKILTRKVLESYSLELINKIESVLTSCLIMTYSLWAYGPLIGGSKSPWMIVTIPLVLIGTFRYQMLSGSNSDDRRSEIKLYNLETPENVILYDRPIQRILFLWILIIIYIGFNL